MIPLGKRLLFIALLIGLAFWSCKNELEKPANCNGVEEGNGERDNSSCKEVYIIIT